MLVSVRSHRDIDRQRERESESESESESERERERERKKERENEQTLFLHPDQKFVPTHTNVAYISSLTHLDT